VRRAHRGGCLVVVLHAGVVDAREAEVSESHVAVGGEEDVAWLDVSVDDAFAVEVGERGEELREPELQLRFGESFVSAFGAPRQAGEVAAVAVPHDDAYGVRLFDPAAVVRDDVGVAERGDELAFLDAELPLPFAQPRQRDLLEDVPTRGGGVGPAGLDDPRGAEGTLTDLLEDVVRVHARRALVRGCHRVLVSRDGCPHEKGAPDPDDDGDRRRCDVAGFRL
jgi:hypothetical protein